MDNDPKPKQGEAVSRKPALKQDDPEQSKRFLEAAREAGADETPNGAERAFKAVVEPRDQRTAKALKVAQEYADDQRAILKKLGKPDAKH